MSNTATTVRLTKKLARDLGYGWYSVVLDDEGAEASAITRARARAFLVDSEAAWRGEAEPPHPFAAILAALGALSPVEQRVWLESVCDGARTGLHAAERRDASTRCAAGE